MSYLHTPRLIFTGDFRADVSTVNNDTAHYNNTTFKPNFQEYGPSGTNGWWNPEGGATFTFLDCKVQQITLPEGSSLSDPAADLIIGKAVGNPTDRSPGKMVDLDPDEQGSSELWAVVLRISDTGGEMMLQGNIKPTAFRDLQTRQHQGAEINGQALGGTWTSVLTEVEWGEKAADSPFLVKLRSATRGNKLSLNLNAYGYYYAHAADGRFSLGKICGAIGPWFENEPELFASARRLNGVVQILTIPDAGRRPPKIYFNESNFLFEKESKRLTLDLGGSFPVASALGRISNSQRLVLAAAKDTVSYVPDLDLQTLEESDFIPVGEVNYKTTDWLNKTGGIAVFNELSDEAIAQLEEHQLLLLTPLIYDPGKYVVIARETIGGYLARADNFVQRLDSGQTNDVVFYAYQWGRPLADTGINVTMMPRTDDTPVGPGNPISIIYGNNFP